MAEIPKFDEEVVGNKATYSFQVPDFLTGFYVTCCFDEPDAQSELQVDQETQIHRVQIETSLANAPFVKPKAEKLHQNIYQMV